MFVVATAAVAAAVDGRLLLCLQAEVQVPEPPADRITQLTEMGFSDVLARNALLLHRSNVEAALEWLLEHGDDPEAADPIPQERLRQVRCLSRQHAQTAKPACCLCAAGSRRCMSAGTAGRSCFRRQELLFSQVD